ncbi:MAG: type II toxin-antitoxin system HicB family antitoxin [Methylomicrobium sp.]
MKYVAIIQPSGRGLSTSFTAYSPDFPGCLARGTTEETAKEALKEAIMNYLEKLETEGLEIPKTYCKIEIIEVTSLLNTKE